MASNININTVGLGINWKLNETYRVALTKGFAVSTGNLHLPQPANSSIMTFTTHASAPKVSTTSPNANTTANLSFTNISFTVDRNFLTILGNGNINLYNANTNALIKSYNVNSNASISNVTTTNSNTIFTINTVGLLNPSTKYYVTANANIAVDKDGFKFTGISGNTAFPFYTPIAPIVANTFPINNSVGEVGFEYISFTLDRTASKTTGNITIYDANTNAVIKTFDINSSNISVANVGANAVFSITTINELDPSRSYFIKTSSNIAKDGSGFLFPGITSNTAFKFTTPIVPQLTDTLPANASTAGANTQSIILYFDRGMLPNAGNLYLYNSDLSQLVATIPAANLIYSTNAVTANIAFKLDANGHYYVTTDANVIYDYTHLKYPGITSASALTFTAPSAPTLDSTDPINGNNAVIENTTISFNLNRNAYANTGNIYLYDSSNNLIKQYDIKTNANIINTNISTSIAGILNPSTSYYVKTDANVLQDISGCKFAGLLTSNLFAFTTRSDFSTDWPNILYNTSFNASLVSILPSNQLITGTPWDSNVYSLQLTTSIPLDGISSTSTLANISAYYASIIGYPESYAGGTSAITANGFSAGGGGGGSGAIGGNGFNTGNSRTYGGPGGVGVYSTITGVGTYYAGGGGGGTSSSAGIAAGGTGGGGSGGNNGHINGYSATYYGSGGGGASAGGTPGSGYQGIIYVKYLTNADNSITGGNISTVGAYTLHTFTSSANLVITNPSNILVEYLIVGGGANGIGYGGGGAGGVRKGYVNLGIATYPVIVGNIGLESRFANISASGGGYSQGGTGNLVAGSSGGARINSTSFTSNCLVTGNVIAINDALTKLTVTRNGAIPTTGSVTGNLNYILVNGNGLASNRTKTITVLGSSGVLPTTPGTDPNFANVSLLITGGGPNTSDNIVDSSSKNIQFRTQLSSSNSRTGVLYSEVQTKFANSSLYFDGGYNTTFEIYTGNDISGGPSWSTGGLPSEYKTAFSSLSSTADWTWEMWVYPLNATGNRYILSLGAVTIGQQNGIYWSAGNIGSGSSPIGTWTVNSWQHIAITRNGNNFRLFKDGSLIETKTSSQTLSQTTIVIGGETYNAGRNFQGFIEGIRFTNGVARYTSSFSPPTGPFPTS